MRISLFLAGALAVAVAQPGRAAPPHYSVTDLGTLGGDMSKGVALNASGQVTGESRTASAQYHAFFYDGAAMHDIGTKLGNNFGNSINDFGAIAGSMTVGTDEHAMLYDGAVHDLGTLGGHSSAAHGINNSGWVTGQTGLMGGGTHAFLYGGTIMHDLGAIDGDFSIGYAINDAGQVTGLSSVPGGGHHAFRYDGSGMIDLGTLGGINSIGRDINDKGWVTGDSLAAPNSLGQSFPHAFFNDGTAMHDLGTLGGFFSAGYGINHKGWITGSSSRLNFPGDHAFIWDGTTMYDLNDLIAPSSGWVLTNGSDINDFGQITGYGTVNGETHAFLLTPINRGVASAPEPAAWTMMLLGFGMIGAAMPARRKRRSALA
jgi:probable HAF family extracellular repeat protein